MKKRDYIRIKAINWVEKFREVDGSYYNYVAEMYSPSEVIEFEIRKELLERDWREIKTNNEFLIFEKEKHIIRISKLY